MGEMMRETQQVPAISVIMSVYNGEQTVERAVASILNQSLQSLELIVCDDASTDGTWARLEACAASDGRLHLLRNERNLGAGASRNRCLACARGRYIALMDADDASQPERLEKQAETLDTRPELAFVGTRGAYSSGGSYWFLAAPKKEDFLMTLPFVHASLMLRREVLEQLGGYDESRLLARAEDYDLLMRAYAAGNHGVNLPEPLYVIRAGSLSYRLTLRERLCECVMKWRGFSRLGLMPRGVPYALKPLMMYCIPLPLLKRLKRRYYSGREKL